MDEFCGSTFWVTFDFGFITTQLLIYKKQTFRMRMKRGIRIIQTLRLALNKQS